MFPLSCEALRVKLKNIRLRRQLTVQCDCYQRDTCSGFTAVLHNEKAIVLSFRSTTRFMQLVEEIEKSVFVKIQSSWMFGVKVSKYFGDGFQKPWDDYIALNRMYPVYGIWVTRHSLGGSLASLTASYPIGSNSSMPNGMKLVTFGQPRTGNLQFSITHNSQLKYSFRVTHWRGVVPHIPLQRAVHCYHHNEEAFYKYNMAANSVIICSDMRCSDGLWLNSSIAEHKHYFGKQMDDYGESGWVLKE
ncbi:unnamed protein product [Angiostrongylus costaricensis]|uniref:Lipase_3 domain-containing protein n=1 Tax=Angiostrongylus costaricensis TaxID=334426 RepID=A0A0R3PZK7_ANGCS|nr:unnamed protein product [Angiostrongylus costaricensis]